MQWFSPYLVKKLWKRKKINTGNGFAAVLNNKRALTKGPKVVALGGGTGLSTLLRGLKLYTSNITAVVTVADDGGSSGMLREDLGILPPGDIRNCILALSNVEPAMEKVFQYRFKEGSLKGQNLGNLLIAAMSDIANGFEPALEQISNVLAITGRVYPVSLEDLHLEAVLEDGTVIDGESRIPVIQMKKNSPISRIIIKPSSCKAFPKVLEAIKDADAVVIGPGSLYTSIIPNILIGDVAETIKRSLAVKIYVSNIMTQPGETCGYTVSDHVKALFRHGGEGLFDYVLVNTGKLPYPILERYRQEMSDMVFYDKDKLKELGVRTLEADLLHIRDKLVRHDSKVLAKQVINLVLAQKHTNRPSYLKK